MKEFIKNNKITYNLMSFTAFKTLLIFSMLLESPKSYQDIIDYFETHDFLNEKVSVDTVRVYINSLRRAGCVITKTKRAEGSKFVLVSHPFEMTVSPEQIKTISKVYKTIAKTSDIADMILLEKFLRKISDNVKNGDLKELLYKISVFSGIDLKLLEELFRCCRNKLQIVLNYNSPRAGATDLELICEKLGFENGKLYLYGTSIDFNQAVYFQVARIIGINEIKLHKSSHLNIKELTVKYKIKTELGGIQLKDFEKITGQNADSIIVEAVSSNKFMLKQRILSFGSACTLLEPDDFRQEIIDTLKKMRAEY